MAIIRREEQQGDPLDRYLITVWSYKWLIAAIAIAAGLITFISLHFVPETYRVSSEMFVNRLSPAPEEETPNPETVTSLLKSQSVLEKVRNDFVRKFALERPPAIESFAKQFKVQSFILQDTTVQKQYSPVLSLQVEAKGSNETRYIMDRWIYHFVADYGNYTTQEAVAKRDAFLQEKLRLESEINEVERKRAQFDAELPYLKRILAEKLELLTPSRLQFQDQDVDTIKLDFSIQNPRMRNGLLERYTQLQLEMQAGNAPSTAPAEMAAISTAIQDAETSIAVAEKELGDARYLQLQAIRHLDLLTANQKAVNDAVSRFTVAAGAYKNMLIDGMPAGGDIRALSAPVQPETRVWPRRTLTSAVVAILAAIIVILYLLSRNFLTRLSATAVQ